MILSLSANNCILVAKNESKSKDGSKSYYKIGLVQDGNTGELNCPEDIFKQLSDDNLYKPCDIIVTYRDGGEYGTYIQLASLKFRNNNSKWEVVEYSPEELPFYYSDDDN